MILPHPAGLAFSGLQRGGALFQEASGGFPLRWLWFLAGAWILVGILSGALCAHMAWRRRRSPVFWFAAGLVANLAALGLLAVAARPSERLPPRLAKMPATAVPAACPSCGAWNHPASSRCSSCGARLEPAYEPETRRAGDR